MEIEPIARLRCDLTGKFGIPRQSGLVESLEGEVVFAPRYRDREALRGIEGFSHLWLIWEFSANPAAGERWSPTVRPPRLGGNVRLGVFATRSPFRPNNLGLSCVRLLGLREDRALGTVLRISGADLMDGTPIYDIKPYIPYADCHPEAAGGFASRTPEPLAVDCPPALLAPLGPEKRDALLGILAQDPRPRYQRDPERIYGLDYAGFNVRFRVEGGAVRVLELQPLRSST